MAKAKQAWPLALVLWLCLGLVTWAQIQVGGVAGVGSAGSGNGVTGYFADGTAGAPSIAFASDADGTGTGWYRQAANVISMALNGAERARYAGALSEFSGAVNVTSSFGLTTAIGSTADTTLIRGGTTGSLRIAGGTIPTQSATTCGTGPTIAGNNTNGSVILGTGPTLPCAIVFNGTWTGAPYCYLNPEILTTGTTTVRATSITTTGFVITSSAALVATDKVTWFCIG